MTSLSLAESRPLLVARLGFRDYRAVYTNKILVNSILSRALLQVCFFAMIGRTTAGYPGQVYAFVGSLMLLTAVPPMVQAPDVIVDDKWQKTLYRLRLGEMPILQIMLLRSWPYLLQGLATSLIALVTLGPVFLGVSTAFDTLRMWPALVLSSVSAACLGMFVGVASLGKRGDVLLANGAQYLVMLCSGAVAPVSAYPVLDAIGRVLPGHHVLTFVRGGSWAGPGWSLLCEVMVGLLWLALAQALFVIQSRRVRKGGFDDYA